MRVHGTPLKSGRNEELGMTVVNTKDGCFLRANSSFRPGAAHAKFLAYGKRMGMSSKLASRINKIITRELGTRKRPNLFRELVNRGMSLGAEDQLGCLTAFCDIDTHTTLRFEDFFSSFPTHVFPDSDSLEISLQPTDLLSFYPNRPHYRFRGIAVWFGEDGYQGDSIAYSEQRKMEENEMPEEWFAFKRPDGAQYYLFLLLCTFTSDSETANTTTILRIHKAGNFN